MECPDENRWVEFVEGLLPDADRAELDRHVDTCASCRLLLATFAHGSVEDVADELAAGSSVVGRYQVEDVVGTGGMSVVYVAYDRALDRRVALKVLREGDPREAGRLQREARAMAKLAHPNVVPVYDVGVLGDRMFLTAELVPGRTVARWIAQSPTRPWRAVVDVFLQAARGLAAAHTAGIVHRDFKPSNVLLGDDGRARVADFGLARPVDDPEPERGLVGTPAYMAPEQLAGQPGDARSDIFSFCVTLFEALHGERPSAGKIRRSRARVPGWLDRAIAIGLHAKPDERWPSVAALLAAIDRGRSSARRRIVAGLAVCGLALAAAIVLVVRAGAPATRDAAALAYEAGLQSVRDGDGGQFASFARATELDPTFGAAHLRYALAEFWNHQLLAREHLARAHELEASLDTRDRMILHAAQQWMQTQPADGAAYARAIAEVEAAYPRDAEVAFYAATAVVESGDRDRAIQLLDHVLALDPSFTAAYFYKEEELAYSGDISGAFADVRACLAHAHNPTGCLLEQMAFDAVEGNCDRLWATSRQLVARNPTYHPLFYYAASAAVALGQSRDTVRDLLLQEIANSPPPLRTGFDLLSLGAVDALAGDFDAVRGRAERLETAIASDTDARWHAAAAEWRTRVAREAGRVREAGVEAARFLDRKQAWMEEARGGDSEISRDPTPYLLAAERAAGLLSPEQFEQRRLAWVDDWKQRIQPNCTSFVWLHGYAAIAETPEDAGRALAELPKFGEVPRYAPYTLGDAAIGKVYFLAGRNADALVFLQRAARSCLALTAPFDHTESYVTLGRALAAAGKTDEACSAYAAVIARWGNARPQSVTAAEARHLATALGCQ